MLLKCFFLNISDVYSVYTLRKCEHTRTRISLVSNSIEYQPYIHGYTSIDGRGDGGKQRGAL